MEVLLILIGVLLGFGVGYLVRHLLGKNKRVGILHVTTTDPDGPYLFLEASSDLRHIMRKRYVTFKVAINKYISQK